MGQYETIIKHFNSKPLGSAFTNDMMHKAISHLGVDKKNITGLTGMFYKMGIVSRTKVKNRKRNQPKFLMKKIRSLSNTDVANLTHHPQCMEYKKNLNARFAAKKKKVIPASPHKAPVINLPVAVEKAVEQAQPSGKISIETLPDRTVITVWK